MKNFYINPEEKIPISKDTMWTLWFLAKDSLEQGDKPQFLDMLKIIREIETDDNDSDKERIMNSLENRYRDFLDNQEKPIENDSVFHEYFEREDWKMKLKDEEELEFDDTLYDELDDYRREVAIREGIEPQILLDRQSIRKLASVKPTDKKELLSIDNINEKFYDICGEELIGIISDHKITHFDEKNEDLYEKEGKYRIDAPTGSKEWKEKLKRKYPRAYEKWTEKEEDKLIELYKSGKSITQISNKIDRAPGGVKSRLSKIEEEKDIELKKY